MSKKDEFNKKALFETEFDPPLNEIRIALNRERIPFLFVAAVANEKKKTEYRVKLDANRADGDMRDETLICGGITPGAMDVDLYDDRMKEIVKVLNGCNAELPPSSLEFDEEDFTSMRSIIQSRCQEAEEPVRTEGYPMIPDWESRTASAGGMEMEDSYAALSSKTAARALFNEDEEWALGMGLKEPNFDLTSKKQPGRRAAGEACCSCH